MSVYEKLKALNISLPEVTQPVAAFVPFVSSGKLLFVSGHIAKIDGKPWVGQLGRELSTEQGKDAVDARLQPSQKAGQFFGQARIAPTY